MSSKVGQRGRNKIVLYRMDKDVVILEVNNPPVNVMRCDKIRALHIDHFIWQPALGRSPDSQTESS